MSEAVSVRSSQVSGRVLFDGSKIVSQSIEAVKSLLSCVGRSSEPLPSFVELAGGVRLTLSSKKDCYYTSSSRDCSCPSRTYHPYHACKHMKSLAPSRSQAQEEESWINTAGFKPVLE